MAPFLAPFLGAIWDRAWESGTNPHYLFGLHSADRLSARARAGGCSQSRNTIIHSAGRYSEEVVEFATESITSVKSCEKHSNSAQNSGKATDIRTNATDVETRINIVQ